MGGNRNKSDNRAINSAALRRKEADSEKAALALQEMVDALAALPVLEEFVPAALKIVARAFQTKDCAYYEHRAGDPIRLRYWFFEGKVFGPEDIRAFVDEHEISEMKAMESGFVVPDTYWGCHSASERKHLFATTRLMLPERRVMRHENALTGA